VFCPALRGCHSQGETVEEALANIREAAELYVESLTAHGQPPPTSPDVIVAATEVEVSAAAS
jgi:predicted RNase H-like HicB family nuclease